VLIFRLLQMLSANLQAGARRALRSASLNLVMVASLIAMIAFVAAALFVAVREAFGAVAACIACAALFGLIAVIASVCLDRMQQSLKTHRVAAPKSATVSAMSDPVVVAAGIELARAAGFRRLLPLLALAGVAAAVAARWAPRNRSTGPAEHGKAR